MKSVLNSASWLCKWVMSAVIVLLIFFSVFLWLSSIDRQITTGEYHGFKIGSSKKEAYEVLLSAAGTLELEHHVVLFNDELKHNKSPVVIRANFHNEEYDIFEDKNEWNLFVDSAYFFDNIRLSFCDETLCKIWRRRSYLELP